MLVFPSSLFSLHSKDIDFDLPSLSGGRSLTGDEDRIYPTGGGLWRAQLNEVALTSRQRVMAWRAFRSATNGGADPFVFPVCDARHQPVEALGQTTFSDGTTFSDDSVFSQATVDVEVSADAALRATSLTLTLNLLPKPLIGGERFSINHPIWSHRMYQVGQITNLSDDEVEVQFHPPLREAVTAGTAVDFEAPRFVCIMRQNSAPMLNTKFARAEASFSEDMTGVYA